MTEKKKIERMNTLYQTATSRFLDKIDFDVTEFMTQEEQDEYRILGLEIDKQCPFCGEDEDGCVCQMRRDEGRSLTANHEE